jgi:hypothetical protein
MKAARARIKWIMVVEMENLLAIFLSLKNPVVGVFSRQVIGQYNQDAADNGFKKPYRCG